MKSFLAFASIVALASVWGCNPDVDKAGSKSTSTIDKVKEEVKEGEKAAKEEMKKVEENVKPTVDKLEEKATEGMKAADSAVAPAKEAIKEGVHKVTDEAKELLKKTETKSPEKPDAGPELPPVPSDKPLEKSTDESKGTLDKGDGSPK